MDRIMILPGIMVGLCFHEYAHAKMSYVLGDPTPKMQGRVTLNPRAHVDPLGFLALIFFGFGWGRPVQINPYYYKHRRRDEILVGLAGVTMNLLIAISGAGILRLLFAVAGQMVYTSAVFMIIQQIMTGLIQINLVLLFFNLIPLPPLDGFGVATQLLELDRKPWFQKFYQLGPMFLMIMIVLNLTSKIISPLVMWSYGAIINIFF